MSLSDFYFVIQWWFVFFLIGIIFLPITTLIFSNFFDKGYIFSKILGMAFVSYAVFVLGTLKILPFTFSTIFLIASLFVAINTFILKKNTKSTIRIFLFEELLFFAGIVFWSYIRGFQPDIHGLEKYMDFGFINSILRADYFPPKDMWFTPFSINYYYFGHLVTAVLTKASMLPSNMTYNLMLATIFAFTFTCSFSIGANLINQLKIQNLKVLIIGGVLTAFLVSMAGNLHTIYTFFKPYTNENPVPVWQLAFSPNTLPNNYWYPNATRFIHNTIHEFPMYSFVVSDLHGHVIDIPFVLMTIAVLLSLIFNFQFSIFNQIKNYKNKNSFQISNFKFQILLISFLLAIMYMTNAWDGIIYGLLTLFIFFYLAHRSKNYTLYAIRYTLILAGFFLFSLPFSLHFKPFVSGIGVLCAPNFLTDIGKIGPFLFEKDHCQHSPWWQMLILYGFFCFWAVSFLIFIWKKLKTKHYTLYASDVFVLLLILLSAVLIILPEFIYVKDIYPAHYRANTMFKLVYQSFMMLSLSSGYIILRIVLSIRYYVRTTCYILLATILVLLVSIYPYFAINSYYGNLQTYYGLDGTAYLKKQYPTDYNAIGWLNKNIKGQPVILEAQGDSYTDYARVSSNTGLPTVLGWTVHEWLWRGTYDIPAPRINEVKMLYETSDLTSTKQLMDKYKISLIFIGDLERQKYPNLNIKKFDRLGKIIYQNNQTKIYQVY
ncbi:MAG: hypothetical protein HYV37_00870 [Candidatus Levyibacteriota bacterium]|nr:MAG: hypothetical protein HYV37_00870 [Candidatus Levybacteria bacterium]